MCSSTMVARKLVNDIELLPVAQINEDLRSSHAWSLTDLTSEFAFPSTGRNQCFFTFDGVVGTEFSDWFTTR